MSVSTSQCLWKYCEYELPFGTTFEQTAAWQLEMIHVDEWKVQMHGNITCYEGIKCDSGLLCLDWREICNGIQNCMFGLDEENCDLLELNVCEEDEYRCSNGMCIPEEYFLDGEQDCLDWTDEMRYWNDDMCPWQSVSIECDDHICLRNRWPCGDGQCISFQLYFQTEQSSSACTNRRDHYFMCENHYTTPMWTMKNGRCTGDEEYSVDLPIDAKEEETCEYLLKCTLSQGAAKGCPCGRGTTECVDILSQNCSLPIIQYPKGAVIAPFLFFYFKTTRRSTSVIPDHILINGTIKCRHKFVYVNIFLHSYSDAINNEIVSDIFCNEKIDRETFASNDSMHQCFRPNEAIDMCKEWNSCLSITRIKDGSKDCLNGLDEADHAIDVIDNTCSRVQHHRFRCSIDQPTCFPVIALGDDLNDCHNRYDELWRGTYQRLLDMKCGLATTVDCSLVRRYIIQSWLSMDDNNTEMEMEMSFRSYCDTFWDLKSTEDEDLVECNGWWQCTESQYRCNTGQCITDRWKGDFHKEWDCADASDEHPFLESLTKQVLNRLSTNSSYEEIIWASETCHPESAFICLSSHSTHVRHIICLNQSQLGNHQIDCLGAIDERNTLRHCSSSLAMLGYNFICESTNTCIPFFKHCRRNNRCPNRTDDDHWCSRSVTTLNCAEREDFICFDGRCVKSRRCDKKFDCRFGEDEYMCDYESQEKNVIIPYRTAKQSGARNVAQFVALPLLPTDLNITSSFASVINFPHTLTEDRSKSSLSLAASLTPYMCNRGIGILSTNDSIVCFCPPQYFGPYCEYHADRLLLLLHLNLSQSIYTHQTDPSLVIKLLVLFLFHDGDDDQVLMTHEFHVRPALEVSTIKKKMVTFPYSQSSRFRQHRQDRYKNRSDIIYSQSYSIRIEAYEMIETTRLSLMAVWQYSIMFDYLPVFRFAKVLHWIDLDQWNNNPCSSQPCPLNSQCHRLMNDRQRFVCLCKPDYTGNNCTVRDQLCVTGYCASDSLCLPNYRSLLRGNGNPYCVCPLNRYGPRCEITHDACHLRNPCLNGGLCQSTSRPNRIFCLCQNDYRGAHCEIEKNRSSIIYCGSRHN